LRLLLDTHIFIWWLTRERQLSPAAVAAIQDPDNEVFLSLATAWEIGIKKGINKLDAPDDLEEQMALHQFAALPITFAHARAVGLLPMLHRDPFDRMLVAQAQVEEMTILTRDPRIGRYEVSTIRA
jgi:PIN domain nuclease of toxin-antitoxin system